MTQKRKKPSGRKKGSVRKGCVTITPKVTITAPEIKLPYTATLPKTLVDDFKPSLFARFMSWLKG